MSDSDQLCDLGQKLASVLMASYGVTAVGSKLVFLPGGVTVPSCLVQSGMVNPTQMQTWLSINFDSPFTIAPGNGSVLEKDSSHGSASRLYTIAATSARPLSDPGSDTWIRVNAEIAGAQRSLGSTDASKTVICEPDDWPLPSANVGYWTKFDSTEAQTSAITSITTAPVVRSSSWMIRSLMSSEDVAPIETVTQSPPLEVDLPVRAFSKTMATRALVEESRVIPVMMQHVAPLNIGTARIARPINIDPLVQEVVSTSGIRAEHTNEISLEASAKISPQRQLASWRLNASSGLISDRVNTGVLLRHSPPVEIATTTSESTIKIHLEHLCITLGYYSAGQPWWDGVFLADKGWFVPGMAKGGLLPAAEGDEDATFGLPIGLVVVQNLSVSGQWSKEAATVLSSPGGTLGPLSLFGASAKMEADGVTISYRHDGMQVVALLCNPLPIIPPVDDPALNLSPDSSIPQ